MSWELTSIKKDWLLGAKCTYSDDDILKGFLAVDKYLGKDFIKAHWKDLRGAVFVYKIVNLGLSLELIGNVKGADKLIKKLLNKKTYNSALAELNIGVSFAENNLLSEVYPLSPNTKNELDFKLSKDTKVVYVEATSPKSEVVDKYLMRVMTKLSKINKVMPNVRLEVYLHDLVDEQGLKELYNKCRQLLKAGKIGVEYKEDNKYIIILSKDSEEKMSKIKKKKEEDESILFITKIDQEKGMKNITTVGIPSADKRAEEVLEGKYGQLVDKFPNIVVIDVSGVPKGIENWEGLIKRRLQPSLNRKISAVLLYSSVLSTTEGIQTEYVWINNKHASVKLDKEFSIQI